MNPFEQMLLLSQSAPQAFSAALSPGLQAEAQRQAAAAAAEKRKQQLMTVGGVAAAVVVIGLVGKKAGWWKRLGF